ncbi:MAG: DinB family protein [Rhodothermales bacterium]|nr:DinB family protein [Rhodothermales bacterium]
MDNPDIRNAEMPHFSVRPEEDEYPSYYEPYIKLVPETNVVNYMIQQLASLTHLLQSVGESDAGFRYAEGKWSIKELVGHLCDSERIFGYRALRFARNDETALPEYDHDRYVETANFDRRILHSLSEELYNLRKANIRLFRSFTAEELSRWGTASGGKFTVRSIMFITAGHTAHHMDVLKDKYLGEL